MNNRNLYIDLLSKHSIPTSIHSQLVQVISDSKALQFNDILKILQTIDPNFSILNCTKLIVDLIEFNESIDEIDFTIWRYTHDSWERLSLEAEEVKLIEGMIKKNKTLKKLDFYGNTGLANGVVEPIINALKHNRTISEVDFSRCDLTPNDSNMIVDMLKVNRTIRKVYLRYCSLDNKTEEIIADILKNKPKPPKFKSLDISKNGYGLLLDTFKDKSIQYFSKRAPMANKVIVGHAIYGGYLGTKKDSKISDKVRAWNSKTKAIFKDNRYKKNRVPSLFNLTSLFFTERKMLTESVLTKMPLEIQQKFIKQEPDLTYAHYALQNILKDQLKDDFIKYLSESTDAYSLAALGIYSMHLSASAEASELLAESIRIKPNSLNELLSLIQISGIIDPAIYEKVSIHLPFNSENTLVPQ